MNEEERAVFHSSLIIHNSSFQPRPSMLNFSVAVSTFQKPSNRASDEVAALVDFLAAKVRRFDHAFQLAPVVGRELVTVFVDFGRDCKARFGVEDDEVCVKTCGDCPLARVESGEPRRLAAEPARAGFQRVAAPPRLSPNYRQPELKRRDAAPRLRSEERRVG